MINKPTIYSFQILITTLSNKTKFSQKQINGVGGPELHRFLKELAGNQHVFHISVTPFNITSNHLTFIGSAVTGDILLEPLTEVVSSYSYTFNKMTLEAKKKLYRLFVLKHRHLLASGKES